MNQTNLMNDHVEEKHAFWFNSNSVPQEVKSNSLRCRTSSEFNSLLLLFCGLCANHLCSLWESRGSWSPSGMGISGEERPSQNQNSHNARQTYPKGSTQKWMNIKETWWRFSWYPQKKKISLVQKIQGFSVLTFQTINKTHGLNTEWCVTGLYSSTLELGWGWGVGIGLGWRFPVPT